jgi:hypothetical protein
LIDEDDDFVSSAHDRQSLSLDPSGENRPAGISGPTVEEVPEAQPANATASSDMDAMSDRKEPRIDPQFARWARITGGAEAADGNRTRVISLEG